MGGYYTLRGEMTHALIRCGSYRHRPAQADMLHLDVWYGGQNVLVDAGTYSYNLQPPWSGYFAGTASHNTLTVDGRDQMKRGSRFMWLHWTKARLLRFETGPGGGVFEGEHYGYLPVVHRRRVVLRDEVYLVLDEVTGDEAEHTFRLHWLVNDFEIEPREDGATIHVASALTPPLRLAVLASTGGRASWARADEAEPRGWHSLYYGERRPAWSYESVVTARAARFATLFGPDDRVRELLPEGVEGAARLAERWTARGEVGTPEEIDCRV